MFTARYELSPYITQLRFVLKGLKAELNPICHLLALVGARHIVHVGRLRVKVTVCHAVEDLRVPWISEYGGRERQCFCYACTRVP